ncbi:MAG: hypothetical protein QOF58_4006 [Pseudonocardiales bacterium]|jgi:hypothetical protein|nr:hypothetical protein [Pseudonocardiales bacterium]
MTTTGQLLPDAMLERVGADLDRVVQVIRNYRNPLSRRARLRALARSSDFDHIRADKECAITLRALSTGFAAQCVTHDVESEGHWPTAAEARHDFLCDRGRRWSFIIHHRDDCERPRMIDLTGLWEEARSTVQNGGFLPSTGQMDLIALYRYVDEDVRIPLQITAYPLPGSQHRELEAHPAATALPGLRGQVALPDADSDAYLVVIHAEDEDPDLRLASTPFSPADPQATSAYDHDGVTYLRMGYVVL